MKNYSDLGLTNNLMSANGIAAMDRGFVDDYKFSINYQQSKTLVSKINVEELVKTSALGSASADFSVSPILTFSTTLTYVTPHAYEKIFGIPYIALYQGTTINGSTQIWPVRGGSVTAGRYDVQGAYDYQGWDEISSKYRGIIIDTNGTSTQTLVLLTKWWHIDSRSGAATSA